MAFCAMKKKNKMHRGRTKRWAWQAAKFAKDNSVGTAIVEDAIKKDVAQSIGGVAQTLAEHDRTHHPDGFDPEHDTCKYRAEIGELDATDDLGKRKEGVSGKGVATGHEEESQRTDGDGHGEEGGEGLFGKGILGELDKVSGRDIKGSDLDPKRLSAYVKYGGMPRFFAVGDADRRGWTTGWGAEGDVDTSAPSRNKWAYLALENPLNLMEGFRDRGEGEEEADEEEIKAYKVKAFCDAMEKAGEKVNRKLIKANFMAMEAPTVNDLIDEVGSKTFEEAMKKLGHDGFVGDDDAQVTAFDREKVLVQGGEGEEGLEAKKEERDGDKPLVSAAEDAAYMEAVKRGDMETAAKMVREVAGRAFPNTKVVDDDGLPKVMWHGSPNNFTSFEASSGTSLDNVHGIGHWFSPDKMFAKKFLERRRRKKRGNLMSVFLNIEKPRTYTNLTPEPAALEDSMGQFKADVIVNSGGNVFTTADLYSSRISPNDIIKVRQQWQQEGFDGVITKDSTFDMDCGGGTQICIFNNKGIKSADPVTYYDDGSVVPLSKRFGGGNDIRFAVGKDEEVKRPTQTAQDALCEALEAIVMDSMGKSEEAVVGADLEGSRASALEAALEYLEQEGDAPTKENVFSKGWGRKKKVEVEQKPPKVRTVQDELIEALAWALDGEEDLTLKEHDKRHHPDGFNPETDTCKFRERLQKEQDVDTLEVGETERTPLVSEDEDKAYLEAVEKGDMKTAEQMVRDVAARFFEDTEIVGEDGKPLVEYHGTDKQFTQFKDKGHGIWLTPEYESAQQYTEDGKGTPMRVYVSAKKVYDAPFNQFAVITDKDMQGQEASEEELQGLADMMGMTVAEIREKYAEQPIDNIVSTPRFVGMLKKHGYDAMRSAFGGDATLLVVDPAQVKSAEAVTRYDDGSVVPLSKRFGSGKDIRFGGKGKSRKTAKKEGEEKVYEGLSKKQVDQYKKQMAKKHPELDAELILTELGKIEDKKIQGDAFAWVMRGAVKLPEDLYKVEQARELATKAKKDPLQWDTPQACINELLGDGHEVTEKPITVEELKKNPLMSDYQDEGYGVETFQVDDSKEGQALMRRVIDTHWGKDANPWCLLARKKVSAWERQNNQDDYEKSEEWWRGLSKGDREEIAQKIYKPDTDADILEEFVGAESIGDAEGAEDYYYENVAEPLDELQSAWDYWNHYNVLPKRVAFKDGKLLAFMATDQEEDPEDYDSYYERMEGEGRKPLSLEEWQLDFDGQRDIPEQWWDRQDAPHDGIPLGEIEIPDDELHRRVDMGELKGGKITIPKGMKRYIGREGERGYRAWNDANTFYEDIGFGSTIRSEDVPSRELRRQLKNLWIGTLHRGGEFSHGKIIGMFDDGFKLQAMMDGDGKPITEKDEYYSQYAEEFSDLISSFHGANQKNSTTVSDELVSALVGNAVASDESLPPGETLEEHDRRHHPHGYNPDTDTCKFRENLKKKDDVDNLGSPETEKADNQKGGLFGGMLDALKSLATGKSKSKKGDGSGWTEEARRDAETAAKALRNAIRGVKVEFAEGDYKGSGDTRKVIGREPTVEGIAEAKSQYDEVEAAYTNEDGTKKSGWKLAPNGKPTNLTEEQWVTVRTPNFKKWFGDWELAQLLRMAKKAWGDKNYTDKFAFRPSEKLRDRLESLLGHSIDQIVITTSEIRHIKAHHSDAAVEQSRGQEAMTPEDILLIPYVLNNYDVAVLDNSHDSSIGEHAVTICKRINGISVVATIERGKSKQFVISGWKIVSAASMSHIAMSPKPNVLSEADKERIAKDIEDVKRAAEDCSKVVDENGEPKVVFHASSWNPLGENQGEAFFDRDRIGSATDKGYYGAGFYFAKTRGGALQYLPRQGMGNITEVYLNMRKPEYRNYISMDPDVDKAKYDGVIVGGDRYDELPYSDYKNQMEYCVFEPTQIKSATDNIGTFEPDNLDIRFRNEQGKVVGEYDRKTGKITLYPGATVKDVVHDFTHGLWQFAEEEAKAGRDGLQKKFVDIAKSAPQAVKKAVSAAYADQGPSVILEECFTHEMARRSDTAFAKAIETPEGKPWYKRAWGAIKDTWKDFATAMGGNKADLEGIDSMSPAEAANHIIGELAKGRSFGKVKYEEKRGLKDKMLEALTGKKEENGGNGEDKRKAIVGKQGAERLGLGSSAKAQEMEKAGADREKIWRETGWWKGLDGQWRVEIPDIKMKEGAFGGFSHEHDEKRPITDIIDGGDPIFKAYPELKKWKVYAPHPSRLPRGLLGSCNDKKRTITVNAWTNGLYENKEAQRSTLAHELQHAIQRMEGFAEGGDEKDFKEVNIDRLQRQKRRARRNGDEAEAQRIESFIDEVRENALEGMVLVDENMEAYESPFEAYQSLSGETESRNVEKRLAMSEEERSKTPPWATEDVEAERQIVRRDDGNSKRGGKQSFVGTKGAERLGINNKGEAEQMEKAGATREDIWRKTGWWRGKDGKWRVEIPDFQGLKHDGIQKVEDGQKVSLQDLTDAESLVRAYPQLGNLQVYHNPSMGEMAAHTGNKIEIGSRALGDEKKLMRVLRHEVQHAIQQMEGFEYGTDYGGIGSQTMKQHLAEKEVFKRHGIKGRMEFEGRYNEPIYEEMQRLVDKYGLQSTMMARANDPEFGFTATSAEFDRQYDLEDAMASDNPMSNRDYREFVEKVQSPEDRAKFEEAQKKFAEGRKIYREVEAVAHADKRDMHKLVAGEVESRNVERRGQMSSNERASVPPWETADVPEEDQITLR